MTRPLKRALAAAVVLTLLLLGGCAAERSFRNAQALQEAQQTEAALQEYQRALRAEPTNARYRIGYLSARDKAVQHWLALAEQARRKQQDTQAAALYNRVLSVDEGNARALEGLAGIERGRKHAELIAKAHDDAKQGNVDLALSRVRWVLSEDAQHAGALALRTQLLEQQSKPRAGAEAQLAEAYRRPVSLEFRDAQLKQVFEVLSRSSGLNFVLDKDVRGDQRTTIFLRKSTIADAVALTLLTNQLEQRVLDANTVLIYPNNPAKSREYQQLTVRSFFLSSADPKTVANSLKTILKAKDVVVDEKQKMILMRDSPEAIRMAERLVALHDQPEAEVMLDVEILEIKRSRLLQLGVQYPSQVALAPMGSASGVLTVSDLRNLGASTVSATVSPVGLQATETLSDINVLANPRIRSRNHEKAKIQVGQRVPNITSTSTSTGFVAESVQYVDVGLKLEVEPEVSPDGEVAIKVGLEVSSILRQVQTKGGSIAYEIGTRNASTVLRLRDGENQVLAGLINDEDRRSVTGLPGLVHTPALGGTLFGNRQDDVQKSEIVLSITPRIIRSAFRPDLAMGEFESGTEANLRSRGLEGGATSSSAKTDAGSAAPPPSPMPSTPEGVRTPDSAPAAGTPLEPNALDPVPSAAGDAQNAPSPIQGGQPAASAGASALSWRGANQASVGSTLAVDLWAASAQALSVVPVAVNYDPRVLSVVAVEQGSFMSNAGTASSLSKRAEAGTGVVRAVVTAAGGTGVPSEGSLLRIVFKALAPSDGTRVTLTENVRATAPTGEAVLLASPGEWVVRVK
jgi:general secretion pathway protein D